MNENIEHIDADDPSGVNRRQFIGGVSAAAAAASLSGCIFRKDVQKIVPYTKRPEDVIPGVPNYYATSWSVGEVVEGLLVESQEGRPTKIEGNPIHPTSLGATSGWAQASVYGLYDADRSFMPTRGGAKLSWDDTKSFLSGLNGRLLEKQGAGLALLVESEPSPTFQALLRRLKATMPKAMVYRHDPMGRTNARAAAALMDQSGLLPVHFLEGADLIAAFDCDFLGSDGDSVRLSREYAGGRTQAKAGDSMSRMYAVEANLSVTGSNADHRLRLNTASVGSALAFLANELKALGLTLPAEVQPAIGALTGTKAAHAETFLKALAKDIAANQGKSAIMVGERQPPHVQALGIALNQALGNVGKTLKFYKDPLASVDGDIESLTVELNAGRVSHLVMLGGNPAYSAPGQLDFGDAITQATQLSVHLSFRVNETSNRAMVHIPQAHYLESWGDLTSPESPVALQQPLIAPIIGDALTSMEVVAYLLGVEEPSGYKLLREFWMKATAKGGADEAASVRAAQAALTKQEEALKALEASEPAAESWALATLGGSTSAAVDAADALAAHAASVVTATEAVDAAKKALAEAKEAADAADALVAINFERKWRKWLHDGVIDGTTKAVAPFAPKWASVGTWPKPAKNAGYELNFIVDGSVADGRFANNNWLQEMPNVITKIAWDNAAIMSKGTAAKLGVTTGDLVRIGVGERAIQIVAKEQLGIADDSIIMALGYGRTHGGRTADGVGFDVGAIRTVAGASMTYSKDVSALRSKPLRGEESTSAPKTYALALSQTHDSLVPRQGFKRRPLVRVNTISGFQSDPEFVLKDEVMPKEKLKSLWKEPNSQEGNQWAMVIDLNKCTGCNTCALACQAENNIPTVGKSEVMNGRELSWVRLDRYYDGEDDDDPQVLFQPVSCVQCENAPCEQVCPVAATVHSPEGLNDMVYNRCIGTRYCANNCPLKVRRFNFHNYVKRTDKQLGDMQQMQKNPDVTLRFRGVMEKCTYCVQRINAARIEAKKAGHSKIPNGQAVVACQQVCSTGAITFGDMNDPKSPVVEARANSRNYEMLGELNIHARTTYLAKITNPNPALAAKKGA